MIRPFRVAVAEDVLDDLRERLDRTRLPSAVAGAGWDYGTDLAYLNNLVAYWRHTYDWRAAEAALNAMPQFTANVHGVDLRFVHARGKGPAPLPLLFSHGWPGSLGGPQDPGTAHRPRGPRR